MYIASAAKTKSAPSRNCGEPLQNMFCPNLLKSVESTNTHPCQPPVLPVVTVPLILKALHLHTITRATPLVTRGPQLHPLHPEAPAKNKLIMPQRVFQSTQCIPLVPGAAGRNYWLIWTGSGSPLRITQKGRKGWAERARMRKQDDTGSHRGRNK